MITNNGKGILAKYLIGQAASYASHIAIGCGARPRAALSFDLSNMVATSTQATIQTTVTHDLLIGDAITIAGSRNSVIDGYHIITSIPTSTSFTFDVTQSVSNTNISTYGAVVYLNPTYKESLDFEMFRVPIISRGYVTEGGQSNIVLTAELPTSDRYEISEMGLYPAVANPSATVYDSRVLYSFSTNENWEYHKYTDGGTSNTAQAITKISRSLDSGNNIIIVEDEVGTINVFQVDADNSTFLAPDRVERYERGRFVNNSILISGDDSVIETVNGEPVATSGNHIHLTNVALNLDGNSSTDKLKLAFSVINKEGGNPTQNYSVSGLIIPDTVTILVEFLSSEKASSDIQYAKWNIELTNNSDGISFENNRYYVAETQLGDLIKSAGFSWAAVEIIKISVMVKKSGNPSNEFYVGLDGLRLENLTAINPLYSLTGYTILKNTNAETVVKQKNTTNFVEFRFGFGNE